MSELLGYALTTALACCYAELIGYLLHRFLHGGWIRWLTDRHLIHHLELYGPTMKMQTPSYRDRELGGVAGVGWEWIVPSLVLFGLELGALQLLGVPVIEQLIILGGGALWSLLMFHRAHEAMHLAAPSKLFASLLRRRFVRARRRHAIHHLAIDDRGRFLGNFGIMFHGFDRLFGTYLGKVPGRRQIKLDINRGGS